MFRLRTLGGASLERDSVILDSVGAQRKTLALLALLAAARHHGISRDRIALYLWPESDTERARGALKQALHVVRRELASPDAVLGTSQLRLNPAYVQSDLDAFLTALEQGELEKAAALYGGPFLDGFHLSGGGEFEEWVASQRDQLARRHANALEELARAAEARHEHAQAAELWRRILAEDPFSGRAVLGLMQALEAAGERAAALRCAAAHEALLRDELGTPPAPAVVELAERLREEPPPAPARSTELPPRGASPPDETPGAHDTADVRAVEPLPARIRPARPRYLVTAGLALALAVLALDQRGGRAETPGPPDSAQSVAVLPFANVGGNPANAHFAAGVTDALIGTLGTAQGLRVAARTSTLALIGRGRALTAIADTLGVATVLRGDVRRSADRLTIRAELVNARENGVLWSQTYQGGVGDVFAIQEEIARAVTDVLHGRRAPREPVRLASRPTQNLEAYELYLRGRYSWTLPSRERLELAAVYYQRAAERDPAFAMAWAGLADTYVNLSSYAYLPPRQALARATVAADRALALDPGLAEAHASRGFVLASEQRFGAAEAAFRRSIALNPNYPWGHHYYSLLLLMLGRPDQALEHNEHALALDPLSLPANATHGIILLQRNDPAAGARELERALALAPDYPLTLHYLGALRAAQGSYGEALPLLEEAARQTPGFTGVPAALAHVYDRLGRTAAADSIVAGLRKRGDERSRVNLGLAYATRGRLDLAFPILERVTWDKPSLIELRTDPLLAPLRSHPRYRQLIRGIGAGAP